MKILPVITNTSQNIGATSKRLSKAGKSGYEIGMRTSKIHKQCEIATILNISKGVGKKLKKETTINDLPIIAGAVGLLTPIPFASPIMLALGKVVQVIVKSLHKP